MGHVGRAHERVSRDVPKIGELTPERTTWLDNLYLAGFDAGDPANPDPKISLGSLRTAAAELENKTLGEGSVFSEATLTTKNVGTVPTNVTAVEYGDALHHRTVLTLTALALGTSGDNASKANGGLLYTFPAGIIQVKAAILSVGLTIADATKTDTPELGLGTVQASGVQATLGAVGATAENIFEGAAVADVNGTVFNGLKKPTSAPYELLLAAADPHTVYMNIADAWANLVAEAAVAGTGTVTLLWDFLS